MIEFRKRKVQQTNETLSIVLPIEWTKHAGVKKGSTIRAFLAEDKESLLIQPEVQND